MAFVDKLHEIRDEQLREAAAYRERQKMKPWIEEDAGAMFASICHKCEYMAKYPYLGNELDGYIVNDSKNFITEKPFFLDLSDDDKELHPCTGGADPVWRGTNKDDYSQSLKILENKLRAEGFKNINLELYPCYLSRRVTKGFFYPKEVLQETGVLLGYAVKISLVW